MSESPTGRVLLVRHGETDWNRQGRIQGWAPTGLTERGREQARALGRDLATTGGIDRVLASDLRRTRETAALLAEAGLPSATFERAWRERDFGVFQGLTKSEVFGRHPEYAADSGVVAVRTRPPGGERLLDLHERVRAAFDRLRETIGTGTVLVVTHGGPIYVVLGLVKGQDVLSAVTDHDQENCGLTEVRIGESAWVHRENVTV